MDNFPERVPERARFAFRCFIYDAPEDGGGFLCIEGEVAGTGLRPDAVAEGVEGTDGGGGEHALGCVIGDLLVEAKVEDGLGGDGAFNHLQCGGLTTACEGVDH